MLAIKRGFILAVLFAALAAPGQARYLERMAIDSREFALLETTTVFQSDESPTGYYATFRYKAPEAKRVRIRGEWSFSGARLSSLHTSENVMPGDYADGMFPLQVDQNDWPAFDMELCEQTGVWIYTIALPCGVWSYRFIVDGKEGAELTDYENAFVTSDPNNPPVERSLGQQTNSQVFVPFDADKQTADFSIQLPRTDEKTGTLEILYYDPEGLNYELLDEPSVAVYLPCGYDPSREEAYKVLYASHGGGVESETSWWNKGVIGNLTDNLLADYGVEPFVIVLLNNYADSFDHANMLKNVIPLIEGRYNVRSDAEGKALCGISKGAILAKNVLIDSPDSFRYYGLFSGAYFSESEERFETGSLDNCEIYLAAGERETGLTAMYRTAEKLANAGKTDFRVFTVMGGHNWYTWRQVYVDFVLTELWK
ncbi:MAG: alpha/beta hydrolase-fold protein [Clostridia bacterium]|nr:alpha/beta hydrolase-fold protein [Clostridia bacterium]